MAVAAGIRILFCKKKINKEKPKSDSGSRRACFLRTGLLWLRNEAAAATADVISRNVPASGRSHRIRLITQSQALSANCHMATWLLAWPWHCCAVPPSTSTSTSISGSSTGAAAFKFDSTPCRPFSLLSIPLFSAPYSSFWKQKKIKKMFFYRQKIKTCAVTREQNFLCNLFIYLFFTKSETIIFYFCFLGFLNHIGLLLVLFFSTERRAKTSCFGPDHQAWQSGLKQASKHDR